MKLNIDVTKFVTPRRYKRVKITVKVSDLPASEDIAKVLSHPIFYEVDGNPMVVHSLFSSLGETNTAVFKDIIDDSQVKGIIEYIKDVYRRALKQVNELKDWKGTQHLEYRV